MNARELIVQPVLQSREFLQECWTELRKVHFPTRKETRSATIVVIVGVFIVSLYLGVVDFLLTKAVEWLLL